MDKQRQINKVKKRGALSWVLEFTGRKRGHYVGSVALALLSVLSGFLPYTFLANIVRGLLEQTADLPYCLTQCLWMGLFFILDRLFHAASTTLSHKATFEVLANIRRNLTKKLARMPLGDVLDEASGTYKNIIVERVDSIETTLAHMIPEVTSNLIIPFVIFGYMVRIDWRLALLSLLTVPVGALFFLLMMRGSGESYQNTVVKTKALNDTAVEYINGIEVIKAFGKAKTSYEKFVTAAKEGADCFIEWMRRCNVYQNLALVLMPATLLSFWDVGIGSITFGGVDIRSIPLDDYQKKIAYVSQDNYLFDMSVMENIRLGDPSATDEQVMDAAKNCGCHDFIMGLENGYQTVCGGAGGHLSGGERQRISIARAMLKNAPVVILDEATAYTDPENEALVQRSVAKLVKGRTLLVIAHRLSTVADADQIILISDGRVAEHGTQQELLDTSELYRSMWRSHIAAKEGEDNV